MGGGASRGCKTFFRNQFYPLTSLTPFTLLATRTPLATPGLPEGAKHFFEIILSGSLRVQVKANGPDLKNQVPDPLFKMYDFIATELSRTTVLGQSWRGGLQDLQT